MNKFIIILFICIHCTCAVYTDDKEDETRKILEEMVNNIKLQYMPITLDTSKNKIK